MNTGTNFGPIARSCRPTLPHAARWTADTPDGELKPGMVLCVERHIGRFGGHDGVKIEEQVLITESGYEQLSTYPWMHACCPIEPFLAARPAAKHPGPRT